MFIIVCMHTYTCLWLHSWFMWIIVVLKEKRVSSYLPEYEEINDPGRKTTGIHYAVSPQALSDESKNTSKPALQYDYASTGPVSVSGKLNDIVARNHVHCMYICILTYLHHCTPLL